MARRVPGLVGGHVNALAAEVRKDVLWFAGTTWFAALLSLLTWSRLEFVFLGSSHAAREVAIYAAALSAVQLATQPVTLLSGALLPHYSSLSTRGPGFAATSYELSTRLLALVAFPLAFGLSATSAQLVHVLFGGAFDQAAFPTAVLAPIAGLAAVAGAGSSLVYATGRSRFIALSGAIIGTLAVAAFAIVIPRYGVLGASIARAAVQLIAVIAGMVYIRLRLHAKVPVREVALAAASAAVAFVPARLVGAHVGLGWLSLGLGTLVFAAAYAVLVRITRTLRAEDAETLQRIASRAPRGCAGVLRVCICWVGGR
jgi:O-antigen/teichoic acid export membrane protein